MLESRDGRRVVVTGVGVVAPCGIGAADFWAGLAKPVPPSVTREVTGFDPATIGLSKVEIRRLDRFAQLALVAADEAIGDAGLAEESARDGERTGVLIGCGIGGAWSWESQVRLMDEKGPARVSPLTVPMVMPNAAAGAVSMRWGLSGPCETISTACATGTQSIGNAARWIAAGRADTVVAGGTESCLTGVNLAGFGNMRALSPTGVSRPFDADRDGFCAAEGAGILVLEERSRAVARGARIYAEIAGVGSGADAYHITAPAPGGRGAARCMREALADGGVAPAEVTHINAHGTSTPLNDAGEADAIAAVFGDHRPAVTSIKGVTGHSLGGAGAIEAAALSLTFAHRSLPPTVGTTTVDPALDIDVVLSPRDWEPAPALTNSFGFGGHNATLLFTPAG
ncbi:beta-ketoacyl-[acyl-carrier-protein] synthase family protein [Catenuloplanes indicus]|uniref:3-oxoacyl-[acyl-carrier-protein] synthase II n=1 Tax=Catenuloplanes indicus TaxID=137267 RepID=A0AAE3W901_9ACTN|nr:beta-ketoacyl-ACP synthase II [Catenuloplanes indicus]MDQ0370657.1 3-oxoacyl-[acyl-carrier-protein] synthase II [Catenuloplanes indicus]